MKKLLEKAVENGLIVSLFLGLAYLFTYQYQKGKLSYYDIPLIYIDLNIANVIEIFVWILSFLYMLQTFLTIIVDNVPRINSYKGRQMLFFTIAYFVVLFMSIILFKSVSLIAIITLIYLCYALITILIPLITVKDKMSYKQKWLESSEKSQKHVFEEAEFQKRMHLYPQRKQITSIGLIVCVLVSICNIFELAGKNYSKTTEEYYVAIDYNDKVVVHYTNEYYILMKHNENVLENSLQIVPTGEIGTIVLNHTGKLEKEKNNEENT